MKDLRIPMLKQDASAQDIINYLTWLNQSPYAYHIDDCPTDIIWEIETSEEYTNLLKWNHDVMWANQSEEFLWLNYGENISENENF
jgi:hypothetical protein